MKIGFAGPASLRMLSDLVVNGETMPPGYEYPPMSMWTRQLRARGHHVVLFTHARGVTEPQSYYGDRLTIHIGRQRARGRARDFFAHERRDLVALMKADPCDIIHANWTYEFALAALDSGQPVLVTAHDAPFRILRYLPDPYRFMRLCMAWSVARRARHLTAVSSHVAEHFRRYLRYPFPIPIVPNALAPEAFELGKRRLEDPRQGPFTAACVLTGWKGLKNGPVALEAFGLLRKTVPEARLLLFGREYAPGGPAEQWAIKSGLAAGLEFVGSVPNRALLERLSREVDVLIHPSLEEALSVSVMEALALGIPVIAGRRTGGMNDLLEEGRIGLLVDVSSPRKVADAMLKLASEEGLRRELARSSFLSAYKRFQGDVVFDQYEAIYKRVIKPPLILQETGTLASIS